METDQRAFKVIMVLGTLSVILAVLCVHFATQNAEDSDALGVRN
ncbi:MAG: hypothetical protein ACI9EF_001062 [Pseudohongiellaceae bacterium]|jgi:hypothetical protein